MELGRQESNERPLFQLPNGPVMFKNFEDALDSYYAYLNSGREPIGPEIQMHSSDRNGSVVYVQGDFDIFTLGHLQFLQRAAKEGASLIVGINADFGIRSRKGPGFPLLNQFQRALTVLGFRPVQAVVMLTNENTVEIQKFTMKIDFLSI